MNSMDRHIQQTNDRLQCIKQILQTYESLASIVVEKGLKTWVPVAEDSKQIM